MFIKTSFLPDKKVKLVAISGIKKNIIKNIEKHGIECIEIKNYPLLDLPIQSHADMQMLKLKNDIILLAKNLDYLKEKLEQHSFNAIIIDEDIMINYPNDILLNNVLVDNYCIGKYDVMPKKLIEYCTANNIEIVSIKQGYAKCSVAILNNKAIITSDKNISIVYKQLGFDVLLIPHGDIELPGYNYGFIGGCCGMIDKNIIAFTGNLNKYKFGQEVLTFLYKHNIEPLYLSNENLIDIGSILPLKY